MVRARRHRDDSGARRRRPARQRDGQGLVRVAGEARRVRPVRRRRGLGRANDSSAGAQRRWRRQHASLRRFGLRARIKARPAALNDDRLAVVDWYRSRDASAASIWERLSAATSFDFDALLRQPGSTQAAPDAQEIARQWARAHSYASALTSEGDESETSGWPGAAAKLAGTSAAGFGFEASIGAARAHEGLRALEGLTEGFRKL